jgi:hypothetical protein
MRALICWIVIFLMPSAVLAADSPAGVGVLYGTGTVFLDGAQLANSMPVLTGDVIETKEVGVAHLDMSGSIAIIQPNAIVRFHAAGLSLDRGSISMATGKSLSVSARDFQITPLSSAWTQFEVTRSGGVIQITARKNSVTIKCGMGAPTLIREGHQITRADAQDCGLAQKSDSGAIPPIHGAVLTSGWVEAAGTATAGTLLFLTLRHGDDPVSPDKP